MCFEFKIAWIALLFVFLNDTSFVRPCHCDVGDEARHIVSRNLLKSICYQLLTTIKSLERISFAKKTFLR